MKTYRGHRDPYGTVVSVHDGSNVYLLPPREDIRDHSPDGFEWGSAGSGPAQLALALVADAYGDALAVPQLYQHVKAHLIAGLTGDDWTITEEQLACAVAAARQAMQEGW